MRRLLIIVLLLGSVGLTAQSRGLKFLKSLVVPGLSQVSEGRNYGYAMMVSEISIIGGMMYLNSEEKLKARESYEYALKYAHIRPGGYEEIYFRDLSRYNSGGFDADGFNAREERRHESLSSRSVANSNTSILTLIEDMYWNWDSAQKAGQLQ